VKNKLKCMLVGLVWVLSAAVLWSATTTPQAKSSLEGHWLPYGVMFNADGTMTPVNSTPGQTIVLEVDKTQTNFVTHFDNSPNTVGSPSDYRVLGTEVSATSGTTYTILHRNVGDSTPVVAQLFKVLSDGVTLDVMQGVELNAGNAGTCFGQVYNDYLKLDQLNQCTDLAQNVSATLQGSKFMFICKRISDKELEKIESKGQSVARAQLAAERAGYVRDSGQCLWVTAMASFDGGTDISPETGLVVGTSTQYGQVIYRVKFMPYGGPVGYLNVPESGVLGRKWGNCP
jgi:hypothetical protein